MTQMKNEKRNADSATNLCLVPPRSWQIVQIAVTVTILNIILPTRAPREFDLGGWFLELDLVPE